MSSVAALVGITDRAVYSAAKGAILAITRAAAIDHVEEGVRVNCIAPGTVDTPWIGRITAGYDDPEEARRNMQARQPHGRFVSAGGDRRDGGLPRLRRVGVGDRGVHDRGRGHNSQVSEAHRRTVESGYDLMAEQYLATKDPKTRSH